MDHSQISFHINEHLSVIKSIGEENFTTRIGEVCKMIADALNTGNKILLFGNGGSASDAQHIAAEFTGRFVKNRKAYAAIALTTDTSALTAIANDYGFERVFARQVEALARPGDVLIGISTSGNSPNVLQALLAGKEAGCKLVGFTGNTGGQMKGLCDITLLVNSETTARIQEAHILIGHIICSAIDNIS